MTQDKQPEYTRVRLVQSLRTPFGKSDIGVGVILKGEGSLFLPPCGKKGPYALALQMRVRCGDIVPINENFYRIVDVQAAPSPGGFGASRGHVTIDSTPISLEGIQLRPDALAVPLGAEVEIAAYDKAGHALHGYTLEVLDINTSTATLDIWPVEHAKPCTEPELIQSHCVKAGDKLSLSPCTLSILSVVPSNPQRGLRGFVKISLSP